MRVYSHPLRCFVPALALIVVTAVQATAQELNDPYSIMTPERRATRHHGPKSSWRARHASAFRNKNSAEHYARRHRLIARGSPGIVLSTPLPRTQLIPPESGSPPIIRPAPQQQGATVLPGLNPIPNLPHGPETFQDRASRCAFQQGLYNVPGNLGTQYMGACVQ
jgi:hypothetical protein